MPNKINTMTPEEKEIFKSKMLELIPKDGKPIGNVTLLEKFTSITNKLEDDYWTIRNDLITEGILGKGRGKGGSVYLIKVEKSVNAEKAAETKRLKEKDLYKPFFETLKSFWTKDNDVKNYIIQITANQGSKETGGKWTRPDITIIDIKTFPFYPNKILEVITFELKPSDGYGIESVFETAAHTIFAHKSYLVIHYLKEDYENDELIETMRKRCEMFGVGLILFKDPADWKTVIPISESKHNNPDPSEVNQFIVQQIDNKNHHELLSKMK